MVWVASLLTFLVVGGGFVGIAVVRHRLRSDDSAMQELPPDMLVAIARSREAELASRKADVQPQRAEPKPSQTGGPFRDA